jgi:ribonuclease HI
MGLEAMHTLGRKKILIQSDFRAARGAANGEYRVKDEKLKMMYQRALTLLLQFDWCRILPVRREMNNLADRLANRGIDDASRTRTTG